MIKKVFERVEQKYVLSRAEYEKIQELINKNFIKDKYYDSKIYNIYFDNSNNDMIVNSLEKPFYKKKIRLRSYGIPKDDDLVYLELKEKYKGTVYKRRAKLTLLEYNNYINNGILPDKDKQIMKEIDYVIKYYRLKPYIMVAYDRLSYCEKNNIDFRLTFDMNLRSRFNELNLSDKSDDKKYFAEDKYIMEVKCLNALPKWFVNYLSENNIYPCSFSKVGSIYIKERGDKKC